MDPNSLKLTKNEFDAYMLKGVMGSSGQPGETAEDGRTRCGATVAMFRGFEAANPLETMVACHCIAMSLMFDAAMRDANAADLAPADQVRMRASALAISKNLHVWLADFARMHARNETRAAEVAQHPGQPASIARATPQPAAPQALAPQPTQVPPVASAPPFVARPPGPVQQPPPALRLPDQQAQSMKQALLSSVAMARGDAPNGRMGAS